MLLGMRSREVLSRENCTLLSKDEFLSDKSHEPNVYNNKNSKDCGTRQNNTVTRDSTGSYVVCNRRLRWWIFEVSIFFVFFISYFYLIQLSCVISRQKGYPIAVPPLRKNIIFQVIVTAAFMKNFPLSRFRDENYVIKSLRAGMTFSA